MTDTLPGKAKVMIGIAAAASLFPLSIGIINWHMPAWPQLALLTAAAVLSSRLKVKLPGMTSTMSGNLPVILLAVMQLGLFSSLLIAATAAIAQSYASRRRIKAVQLLFNTCTLMNACGVTYAVYHIRFFGAHASGTALSLTLAAAAYFLANTAPVACIVGLSEGNSPLALWHKLFLWSFPNYVLGVGVTAVASLFAAPSGLIAVASLMAVLLGVYKSYKFYVGRDEQELRPLAMAASAR